MEGLVGARAVHAHVGVVKLGARHFLEEPWRLERLDARIRLDDIAGLIAVLAAIAETERGSGRAGHWTYDPNRRLAARQGLVAARFARRFGPGRKCSLQDQSGQDCSGQDCSGQDCGADRR